MNSSIAEKTRPVDRLDDARPKRAGILGVPLGFGASIPGVDLGPYAMRVARLSDRISALGYEVVDHGDLKIPRPQIATANHENPKHLNEMVAACTDLAETVYGILEHHQIPIVLGGDHSIAIGSLTGIAKYFRDHQEPLGLLWFDAHADMNTPETSPTGNIHGMPLSALFGFGAPELVNLGGFAPKLDPRYCAHIGARDVDPGERELIRQLGLHCFTMRDIDEQGMNAVMNQALEIVGQASGGFSVTFDIDALDPRDAPGSGTLVRGGLTYREAHLAMEKLAETGGLRSLEMVEINAALDEQNKTAELGVELILSALGKTIL
jgi:arginase